MKDGRKYVRRQSNDYLLVTDKGTGSMLGRIVDMSPRGIMVMSLNSLTPELTYKLTVKLPPGAFDTDTIELEAKCRWSKLEKSSEMWKNGLEVNEISDAGRSVLQQIVLRLMEHNGHCGEVGNLKGPTSHEKLEYIRMRRYR
ncbi:MAG: PilZ domain-containing protein [Candidatus Zixiibacteriota bacterium]